MRQSLMLTLTASVLALAAVPVLAAPSAEKLVVQAEKSLSKRKFGKAVEQAEAAVMASPGDAAIRTVLGRVYLESGRFRSAADSFADALALDAGRGAAALSLALAKIGLGDLEGARTVLATHGGLIPASDRGLALALAGDLAAAIPLLEESVRSSGVDAKTRQNLALSYALAGRWPEAKLMASYDLDPATLAQRIMDWSLLTREGQAPAQVAALLGVKPGVDAGVPVRLALRAPEPARAAPVQVAQAAPPPPERMALAEPVAAEVVSPPVQPASVPTITTVQFAPLSPIVQQISAYAPSFKAVPAEPTAVKALAAIPRAPLLPRPTGGRFAVQIGAFDSLGVAQASWDRSVRRIGMLRDYTPSTATVARGGAVFHRLSLSGFGSRADAVRVCETLRGRGGSCFVRATAGDMPLQWAVRNGGTRLAARG